MLAWRVVIDQHRIIQLHGGERHQLRGPVMQVSTDASQIAFVQCDHTLRGPLDAPAQRLVLSQQFGKFLYAGAECSALARDHATAAKYDRR